MASRVGEQFGVTTFAVKGTPSITATHEANERFSRYWPRARRVILYFGDYDPTGLHIPVVIKRDVPCAEVIFCGLTNAQVLQYDLELNFAKTSDSNYKDYEVDHGSNSWELDALPVAVLTDIMTDSIEELIVDRLGWNQSLAQERAERTRIKSILDTVDL